MSWSDLILGLSPSGEVVNWPQAFASLGVVDLPTDYVDWISRFGGVYLQDYFRVLSPFASASWLNLVHELDHHREVIDLSEQGMRGEIAAFPAPRGVLVWASTDNGDVIGWETEGPVASWSIVILGSDGLAVERPGGGAVELLRRMFDRDYVCPFFPADFPDD